MESNVSERCPACGRYSGNLGLQSLPAEVQPQLVRVDEFKVCTSCLAKDRTVSAWIQWADDRRLKVDPELAAEVEAARAIATTIVATLFSEDIEDERQRLTDAGYAASYEEAHRDSIRIRTQAERDAEVGHGSGGKPGQKASPVVDNGVYSRNFTLMRDNGFEWLATYVNDNFPNLSPKEVGAAKFVRRVAEIFAAEFVRDFDYRGSSAQLIRVWKKREFAQAEAAVRARLEAVASEGTWVGGDAVADMKQVSGE